MTSLGRRSGLFLFGKRPNRGLSRMHTRPGPAQRLRLPATCTWIVCRWSIIAWKPTLIPLRGKSDDWVRPSSCLEESRWLLWQQLKERDTDGSRTGHIFAIISYYRGPDITHGTHDSVLISLTFYAILYLPLTNIYACVVSVFVLSYPLALILEVPL